MAYFFQGLTIGLAYVAPIGMQNLFVINSALTHSRRRAFLTVLVVLCFEVPLVLGCFFGIGALMQHYEWLQMVILLAGSLLVIFIGIGLLRTKTQEISRSAPSASIKKTITTACVAGWFNPQAIIDGTMLLGAFHVTLPPAQSIPFVSGVIAAACLWFTGLTLVILTFRDRFNARVLRGINVVCGAVIIFYGCRLLYDFFMLIRGGY